MRNPIVKGIDVRWSSLHDMLARFIENKAVIIAFSEMNDGYPKFSRQDFNWMESVVKTLKPLKEATVML
uniref:Uncharacterized protein n=1 Tax=Panagrolaimus superbus TaxID=310955 RepID=A0A914Z9Y1_9BILA